MKERILDLKKSVYDIATEDYIAKSILLNAGFKAVSAPKAMGALRNRTLDQIVPIKGMNLDGLLKLFEEKGYKIINREGKEPEQNEQ